MVRARFRIGGRVEELEWRRTDRSPSWSDPFSIAGDVVSSSNLSLSENDAAAAAAVSTLVGHARLSAEGKLLSVSDAFAHILGCAAEELRGMRFSELSAPADRESCDQALARVIRENEPVSVVHRPVRRGRDTVWLKTVMIRAGGDDPLHSAVVALTLDLTPHWKLEAALNATRRELERRSADCGRLAAELTVAEERERRRIAQVLHDHLQQLMVSAMFRLSMMAGHVSPELEAHVREIQRLIEEANQESRLLTAELAPPVLHEAGLHAAMRWLSRWMEERHGLEVTVTGDAPGVIGREELRVLLFQSIRELLLNVVKHSGVHQAEVILECPTPDELRVSVRDGGRGFRPEQIAGVRSEGGFGLSRIRERLEYFHGSFEIETAPDRGSVFRIHVDLRRLDECARIRREAAVNEPDAADASRGRERIRVFLADDHAMVREALSALIDAEDDLEVVGMAADGEEALTAVRMSRPDVIVIDYSMPKLDGIAATRRIRAEHPATRIICLSMYEENEAAEAMRQAGACRYLSKNGRPEVLLKTIREAVASPAD